MTKKEFLTAVSETLEGELQEYAVAELAKMAERAEKVKNTPHKPTEKELAKKAENEALAADLMNIVFTGDVTSATAKEIATAMDITVQKATVLAKINVAAGKLTVSGDSPKTYTVA